MKKKQIVWLSFVVVFVLPFVLHFTVNIYWWLFDGNQIIFDKVYFSFWAAFLTGSVAGAWAGAGEVWK